MSEDFSPDLEAYFRRINYIGSPKPGLETLNDLIAHQVAAIPFENLDVLFSRGIDISPEAIEKKLIYDSRGGYCFELNQYFFWVCKALGFEVKLLASRVRWLQSRDAIPPRTHIFLEVTLADGIWIADVGVGGCSPTSALRRQENLVQKTKHDSRKIIKVGDVWMHQVRFDEEWQDVCEFTNEEMPLIDRCIGNWWTSTNPESKFRKNLLVAMAPRDGRRLSLLNRQFIERFPDKTAIKTELQDVAEVEKCLQEKFHLNLPNEANRELFENVLKS